MPGPGTGPALGERSPGDAGSRVDSAQKRSGSLLELILEIRICLVTSPLDRILREGPAARRDANSSAAPAGGSREERFARAEDLEALEPDDAEGPRREAEGEVV